ncbi:MAG TPA: hypothetical protein VFS67_05060 [Polyangiaceae bacterium]|nr:hypothetical protein [Polyangiaceae bacterium]
MARFLNAGAMPIEHRALNAINYVARAHLGNLSSRRAAPRVASAARLPWGSATSSSESS